MFQLFKLVVHKVANRSVNLIVAKCLLMLRMCMCMYVGMLAYGSEIGSSKVTITTICMHAYSLNYSRT